MNAQHPYARELEEDEAALQDFLRGVTLLGIDERIRKVFGKEGGRLRATGMMVSDCDLLIGATALRHDLPLLTNNRCHAVSFHRLVTTCAATGAAPRGAHSGSAGINGGANHAGRTSH